MGMAAFVALLSGRLVKSIYFNIKNIRNNLRVSGRQKIIFSNLI